LSFGVISDKNADLKAEREAHYIEKYVTDENDKRGFLGKTFGTLTLGLINGRETKKQMEERLRAEMLYREKYVADENDRRDFIEKGINTATLGLFWQRETKAEYAARLAHEAWLEEQRNKPLYAEN